MVICLTFAVVFFFSKSSDLYSLDLWKVTGLIARSFWSFALGPRPRGLRYCPRR